MAQIATFHFCVIRGESRFSLDGAILTSEVAPPPFLLRPLAFLLGRPASELVPAAYLLKPRTSEAQHPPHQLTRFARYAVSLALLLKSPAYLFGRWAFLLGRRT